MQRHNGFIRKVDIHVKMQFLPQNQLIVMRVIQDNFPTDVVNDDQASSADQWSIEEVIKAKINNSPYRLCAVKK